MEYMVEEAVWQAAVNSSSAADLGTRVYEVVS